MTLKKNEKDMILLLIPDEINFQLVDKFIEDYGIDSLDRDGRSLIFSAITQKKDKLVQYLIDRGSFINLQDKEGFSPLHFTVIQDNPNLTRLLIESGADLNLQDKWGNTPLLRAAMTKLKNQETLIKILIDKGADTSITTPTGISYKELLNR